jgi:hypothetical protein
VSYNKGPEGNVTWSLSRSHLDRLNIHASEYSSVGITYDHYIDNNGSIDDLHTKIQSVVNF